jgi:hypothetical protein
MTRADAPRLPMIWIGGSPGAGKSTLARKMAHAFDLPLHPIDLWAYDHSLRMPPAGSLEEDLARGPEAAAQSFIDISRARLELVGQDIADRGLGEVPALVEGPQLFPSTAEGLPKGYAVWLVPNAEQTRRARESRLARTKDPAGRARLENLLARDVVLARKVREEALTHGYPLIEVPADPEWEPIETAVKAALGPALEEAPRLPPGDELSRQRQIENQAACRQGRLWQADIGLAELPPFPFACECGRSGCQETWPGTPDQYDVRRGDGWLLAQHS